MRDEDIEKSIKSYLAQAIEGASIENDKIDFKRKWYDLSVEPGISEFLKDSSAIANTFGPDGLIIIGFDDRSKEFYPARLKDSKIEDSGRVMDIIAKRVDRLYSVNIRDCDLDGRNISYIHIPPSLDKPHIIRSYYAGTSSPIPQEHMTFVRKSSKTLKASKNDFELMYWDRRNIQPDYLMYLSFHSKSISHTPHQNNLNLSEIRRLEVFITITFENAGRRPVSLSQIRLRLFCRENNGKEYNIIELVSDPIYEVNNIVIQATEAKSLSVIFRPVKEFEFRELEDVQRLFTVFHLFYSQVTADTGILRLSNGQQFSADIFVDCS